MRMKSFIRSVAVLVIASVALTACGKSDGPASADDLDDAQVAYRGAQDLVRAKLGSADVRFPNVSAGVVSSDGNGEHFQSDSLKIQWIDASAFVIGHYSMPDGTGGTFGVNMEDNGGMWEPIGDAGVSITPYQ